MFKTLQIKTKYRERERERERLRSERKMEKWTGDERGATELLASAVNKL